MKKLLSLILVAIMLVTAMPIAMAEDNTYKVGDIIHFGLYPQTEVKDETLIDELNVLAPEWKDWISYGYYVGDGNYGSVQGDWMRYVDVVYKDSKYRGVKFTQYRPSYTCSETSYTNQDDNGYNTNTIYWFEFEHIDWRILDPSEGLVMCESIVDAQAYNNTVYRGDGSNAIYEGGYKTSSIRQWLNCDFYNTAFTDEEKSKIDTTTLNHYYYDSYMLDNAIVDKEFNNDEVKDKIFFLSYNESINSLFGFNPDPYDAYDIARQAQGTDYAKSQGLYVESNDYLYGNSPWFLLPTDDHSINWINIDGSPTCDYYDSVMREVNGVRPVLRFCDIEKISGGHKFTNYISDGKATCVTEGYLIAECEYCNAIDSIPEQGEHKFSDKWVIDTEPTCTVEGSKALFCIYCDGRTAMTSIGKLEHTYEAVVIEPTCTSEGYTTYTCVCGDCYVYDYTSKVAHVDVDLDTYCDVCNYKEREKSLAEKINDLIQSIINFFLRIFSK